MDLYSGHIVDRYLIFSPCYKENLVRRSLLSLQHNKSNISFLFTSGNNLDKEFKSVVDIATIGNYNKLLVVNKNVVLDYDILEILQRKDSLITSAANVNIKKYVKKLNLSACLFDSKIFHLLKDTNVDKTFTLYFNDYVEVDFVKCNYGFVADYTVNFMYTEE